MSLEFDVADCERLDARHPKAPIRYRWAYTVSSAVGDVSVEIHKWPGEGPVDSADLDLVRGLVESFLSHQRDLPRLIHQSYHEVGRTWLRRCGIETGLSGDEILGLVSHPSLIAMPRSQWTDFKDELCFYARPAWDEEHGLCLAPGASGDWERVDA